MKATGALQGQAWARLPLITAAVAAAILGCYALVALFMRPSSTEVGPGVETIVSCQEQAWESATEVATEAGSNCPNLVEVSLAVESIEPTIERVVRGRVQVYPSGSYGGTVVNGGWASKSLLVSGDAVGSRERLIRSNSLIGGQAQAFALDAVEGIGGYPFDRYSTSWTGIVEDAVSGDRVPVVQSATSGSVPGFDVTIQKQALPDDRATPIAFNPMGRFSYVIGAEREPGVRLQVGLLMLTILVGALAALIMTMLILLRRRPPSLAALGWLATFLFALLEVRRNLPGDPPVGIRLDAYVTFPMTFLLVLLIAVNAWAWLGRDDWDMENQPRDEVRQ